MKKLILLLLASFILHPLSFHGSTLAASFVISYAADTASVNVVKVVEVSHSFTDSSPYTYPMTWNGTRQLYETTTISDATFINGYYQIYDGAGTIVVDTFAVNSKIIDGDQVEDVFVRNDADDVKRGNLYIRPASGTTNVELRIDNSSNIITLSSIDTAGSFANSLRLEAVSVDLQNSTTGADISLTGIAPSATSNSAVTRAMSDSTRGSGWTWDSGNNTIMGLRSDVNDLMGTGTFSANDSLFLTGSGAGGGIRINWNFDPAGVNDSINFVQVYYGTTAIPGYSQSGASGLSSGMLSTIRGSMSAIYVPRGVLSTTIPVLENYYIIVVALDHTSPTPQAWGSNQILVTGVPTLIDPSTPLVGTATSYGGAVTTLANEIYNIQSEFGSGGAVKVLFADNNAHQYSSVSLSDYYNVLTAVSENIVVAFRKSSTFDALRLTGQARHSTATKICQPYLVCDALSANTSITSTSATEFTLELDCSSLTDGVTYLAYMKISDSSNSTADTAYVYYPTIEAYNK